MLCAAIPERSEQLYYEVIIFPKKADKSNQTKMEIVIRFNFDCKQIKFDIRKKEFTKSNLAPENGFKKSSS